MDDPVLFAVAMTGGVIGAIIGGLIGGFSWACFGFVLALAPTAIIYKKFLT